MLSRQSWSLLLAVGLTTGSCVGSVGPGADDLGSGVDTVGLPGARGEGSGPGTSTGAAGTGTATWRLQRLTTREYNNTVRDLLKMPTYGGIVLPNDAPGESGFLAAGDVSAQHAQVFLEASEQLAHDALRPQAAQLLPCAPETAGEEPCAVQFIRTFGKRAFRRPLGDDEVSDLTALYREARGALAYDFRGAIGVLLQRFLQSPAFLYHRERIEKPAAAGALVRLGPYELASRLSYLLWETMPDPLLLAAADTGRLTAADEVAAQAERLLADKRASATLASFHRQWLGVPDIGRLEKDGKQFPDFAISIRPSLEGEFAAFVDNVFKGDAQLATLLTSPVAFATPATARLYGLPASIVAALKTGSLSKVDLDPTKRAGLLTQLGFLAGEASATGSNPVKRGVTVWKRLLCGELPPPPQDVPMPPSETAAPNLSTRERFAQHDSKPCASCHKLFDPPGFAFEHYDAVGAWRATDAGKPVDSSGTLTLPTTGVVSFNNAVELMSRLARTEEARRCVVRSWFKYALGRGETDADRPAIDTLTQAAGGESLDLKKLVLAITRSPSFLLRSPSPGEAP